ncbi:MAG: tyrosine-type recombinase/integrase [Candidatus Latescibacterota bacterium]|jgi:site-specific recombinase XerD|nr:MAG: tyrosine-type recombinase/integrase [Candidatus Latescibacterota bacterium]
MLELLFPRAHVRYASLPILGNTLDGLCVWLDALGYPAGAIKRRIRAAALLARALRRHDVRSLGEMTASELRSYAPPPRWYNSPPQGALVRSLIQYLEERGELAPTPLTPTELRVIDYRQYLECVRGLSASTIEVHGATITKFLRFLDHDVRPRQLHDLRGAEVQAFLTHAGQHVSRGRMVQVTAILRSFLRFLAAAGEGPVGLDAQIESPRIYRGARLPRALPWDAVRALLKSIDRTTPKGRRDFAMFLLIATYGLRASEVAALELDDIAWRTRQIRVPRPKVDTPLLLPLTDEVGSAIFDYLRRGRSASTDRHLFLRVEAPLGPLGRGAVGDAFRAWARCAGTPPCGPHCLRHALALRLLREGASLKAIGDLLGHRSAESTGVYLRLDVDDLRDVALPLPATPMAEEARP